MIIALELPDQIESLLQSRWGEVSRRALEALAADAYREGALTRGQVGEMLRLNFWQTEEFLKSRLAFLPYSLEDMRQDQAAHEAALPPEPAP